MFAYFPASDPATILSNRLQLPDQPCPVQLPSDLLDKCYLLLAICYFFLFLSSKNFFYQHFNLSPILKIAPTKWSSCIKISQESQCGYKWFSFHSVFYLRWALLLHFIHLLALQSVWQDVHFWCTWNDSI